MCTAFTRRDSNRGRRASGRIAGDARSGLLRLLLNVSLIGGCGPGLDEGDELAMPAPTWREDFDDDRLPNNRLPNDRLPNDRLPNDRLPNDLPNDRLPNDRLPNDRLPNDRLPNDRLPNGWEAWDRCLALWSISDGVLHQLSRCRGEGAASYIRLGAVLMVDHDADRDGWFVMRV